MTESILKLSEIKAALQREDLNFKIQNSELNGTEDSITFIDACSKVKLRGKIVRTFNEGEVYHWPLFNHENVARLIDILYVQKNLYIYLTVGHEITLKNIVHDKNFVYDVRCFDRKRLYAKGIFSGLSYLHEKSLSLMNLCDDNIIISEICDTAIITNFQHLTCLNKATKSKLNVPELYMAPETEKGEFDVVKAEMWASGILMFDMFLAHMVPWAIVDYKPKKVVHIVDDMSLDLLQAANAGSIVTVVDLAKFQTFLKCFFKQNPKNRIPAKYAAVASFLQNRPQYEKLRNTCQSMGFNEETLPLNYSISKLGEEDLTVCISPPCDTSPNSTSAKPQRREIISTAVALDDSSIQQITNSENDENKKETDLCATKTSENNTEIRSVENLRKNPSPLYYKTVVPEINDNFQKMLKSCEGMNENMKAVSETSYKRYQSKSLPFVKSKSCDNIFELCSKRSCDVFKSKILSVKPSVESDLENSDLYLNRLYSNDDLDNNSIDNNSVVEPDCIKVETSKKISKIVETRLMRNESQMKQHFPCKQEHSTSVRTFKKTIAKPPRSSRAPSYLYISPEVKSIIDKISFLRECFISIQTHQKMFISCTFQRMQQEFIKEYQVLIYQEDIRLREILRKEYELKLEDIAKIMRCAHSRSLTDGNEYENLSMTQNFYATHQNRFLQTRETRKNVKSYLNNAKYSPDDKLKDSNTPTARPDRNYSYWRAIENSRKYIDKNCELAGQLDKEKFKKDCEITSISQEYKLSQMFGTAASNSHKATEKIADIKGNRMIRQYEQTGNYVKTVQAVKNGKGAGSKEAEKKYIENKKKGVDGNVKEKFERNPKKLDSKMINEQTVREGKKLKKREKAKRPWFYTMCPGGRTEE